MRCMAGNTMQHGSCLAVHLCGRLRHTQAWHGQAKTPAAQLHLLKQHACLRTTYVHVQNRCWDKPLEKDDRQAQLLPYMVR